MIVKDDLRLRAIERDDLPIFGEWLNDPEVIMGLGANLPISKAMEEKWFDDMLKRPKEEHPLSFELKVKGKWELLGNVGLMHIHPQDRSAELGIFIGAKNYWDKGIGTRIMEMMLEHGFNTLNLHRIYLRVFANNPRAIRVYEKTGFIREGCLRKDRYYNGEYVDTILMGILREEWIGRTANK